MVEKYADNSGINVELVGLPEMRRPAGFKPCGVQSLEEELKLKKIIWAPHLSIKENQEGLYYLCFFQ